MTILGRVDSKGRLYIPKDVRKGISKEVYLVKIEGEILLVPKPEDPLREPEKLGKSLPYKKPISEIRKEVLKEAEKEVLGSQRIYADTDFFLKGIDDEVPLRAAYYMKEHGLNAFDAFHAAKCGGVIISPDRVYEKVGIKRIRLEDPE